MLHCLSSSLTSPLSGVRWKSICPVLLPTLMLATSVPSPPVASGGSSWWRSGGWTGRSYTCRTCRVTLNSNITHIPTWHYVGGARIKLIVPGKKNCGHCLNSVNDCESGGVWSKCRDKKTARGNWKDSLEMFLRSQCDGWDDKKQKEMEGLEKKDVEAATAGDDEEVEHRLEEERERLEDEANEGLVKQVAEDKTCGGLLLRDMPEGDKEKPLTKEEALLTLIYASGLNEQEADRMRTAESEILPKRDKAKKGVVDVKLTLRDADQLLRKVWRNLEKACKQEGVNRYQLEATSVMSPVRKKPPTLFTKSRIMAREQLEIEQRRERERREEEKEREREEKLKKQEKERATRQEAQERPEVENEVETIKEVINGSEKQQDEIGGAEDMKDMQEEECDSEDETPHSQSETDTPRIKKANLDGPGRIWKVWKGV